MKIKRKIASLKLWEHYFNETKIEKLKYIYIYILIIYIYIYYIYIYIYIYILCIIYIEKNENKNENIVKNINESLTNLRNFVKWKSKKY